jgi:hypothetical protein
LGWAELGVGRVTSDSPETKLFRNIREQATRAGALSRQHLAYARRQVLEPKNIDLNQMINEITTLLQKTIGEQIEVKMALARDLQITRADPSQIEQDRFGNRQTAWGIPGRLQRTGKGLNISRLSRGE